MNKRAEQPGGACAVGSDREATQTATCSRDGTVKLEREQEPCGQTTNLENRKCGFIFQYLARPQIFCWVWKRANPRQGHISRVARNAYASPRPNVSPRNVEFGNYLASRAILSRFPQKEGTDTMGASQRVFSPDKSGLTPDLFIII